ncbi:cholesterol transport system auxiliary component [Rhodobium orientis]|uniref:ABC-type transport auxiliary lipoprotein component domain-containing protein n=1 Tax=Rhodobium orientis TaxID=34017 RepID=A0A327JEQ3_9HYPH|nr:ABC-type transport auxiliary lipoprotein family protein [Rhodobium orientis]MBB4303110.1 cholesterol transport system auxiliary component [Rhodobium orientis]MBK5948259.1 hypothetical protein [Rhodobium orientis]RAI24927.1 hypothetical protein CH339_20620 [Rhodobium orientis]
MRLKSLLLSALLAGVLAGCGSLGGSTPPPIYDLSAPRDFPGLTGRTSAQLLVPPPKAVRALDTQSIAIKPDVSVITYFGDGQWSDTLPKLIQARLVESFENSGRVRAVGRPGEGLLIHYQVVVDVRSFQLELTGGKRAVVEVAVKLLHDRNGRVVAQKIFHAEAPSPSDRVADAVAAMDSAFDAVLTEIVTWVVRKV